MKIKDKILKLLKEKGDLSVKEMADSFGASTQGIHVSLTQLLEQEAVVKFGRTPKTIYRLAPLKSTLLTDCAFLTFDHTLFASFFLNALAG